MSFRNSQWERPPIQYTETLKTEYPEIWALGGNIKGNEQYRILSQIIEQGGSPETPYQERALKLREAWIARHYKDFRIRGVIAQLKWFAIGSRGFDHMKQVVNDEIERRYGDDQ